MNISDKHRQPTFVDLFAGAGGFGLGFTLAGFRASLAVEMDNWACDTLACNHPELNVVSADICNFENAASILNLCPDRPDVIIGGPPCQGFSIAGPAKKDPADPRNSLFKYFAQWISILQPRGFVMENVKGLLGRRNAEGQSVIEIITATFRELGYNIDVWCLNAAEYGVPQNRERIFIIGHHENCIELPAPTHSLAGVDNKNQLSMSDQYLQSGRTLWEAISDLPELQAGQGEEEQSYTHDPQTYFQLWARGEQNTLYNHVAMDHSKRLVERFKHINWGESSSDVPDEHGARRRSGNGELSNVQYDQNNRRLHPHKPSHTIAASFYANFVHPFQHRNLTAREGARIQSFPDSYRFMGKKTVVSQKLLQREERHDEKFLCQYNQIGNAVPPLLAKAIAEHLKNALNLC